MNNTFQLPETDVFFRRKKNVLDWGATEFSILKPQLKNHRVCLDIGAHCGITTLRFAEHFKTVHSFEPLLHNFLVDNTKHLSNVVTHDVAVSNKEDVVEMYPNPSNSGGGIIPGEYNKALIEKRYTGPNPRLKDVKLISVKCVPIDQFNFTTVDLIKIDVEGYILPVIEGMIKTLTVNSPVIQIEMTGFENINNQVVKILQGLKYSKFGQYKSDHFYCKDPS